MYLNEFVVMADPISGVPTDSCCYDASGNTSGDTFVPIPNRVLEYAEQMNMKVVQVNAHRIFGPFSQLEHWEPEPGSEIFVGRIPRYFEEPELVPFLQMLHIGPFYQLRLMMDFSGTNKGYCFVKYFDSFQADRAVRALNGLELRKGRPILAEKSVDNKRLVLGGFPILLPCHQMKEVLMNISGGFDVQVHTIWAAPGYYPKGLAFVTYESHRAAALARKRMLSNKVCLWGCQISAGWAEPEAGFTSAGIPIPEVLQLRNVSPFTSKECLQKFLSFGCGGVKKVRRVNKQTYVYFETRFQAEAAKAALNGHCIDGKVLEAVWVEPCTIPESSRRRKERRQKGAMQPQQKFSNEVTLG